MRRLKGLIFLPYAMVLAGLLLIAPARGTEALLDLPTYEGDLEGMLDKRIIRVLVVYNKMMYFLDGANQRGVTYEAFEQFEKFINERYKLGLPGLDVAFIPVPRDQLLPMLIEGRGDVVAANLTITDERRKLVDFVDPVYTGVKELVVTGPGSPEIASLDDLAGQTVHVRDSSSYYESLTALNRDFESRGLEPVELVAADQYLEDSDLLELLNAGVIPLVVVDSHKAAFWQDVFDNIKVHEDIAVREGGQIAWAIRKNSPELKKVSNEFVKTIKKGTLLGNILFKRYLKENEWVRNPTTDKELEKFDRVVDLFVKYSDEYDFDWLMTIALGYQESRLDQNVRSNAGAIGIMQMLPSTAKDPNVGIPDIDDSDDNVHAGTKYLRFLRDRYFANEDMDEVNKTLFTFASYNAGPAKVGSLRKEASESGLDPNVWFFNVENIAAKRIGRETVQYVSNIYKYFVVYKLIVEERKKTKQAIEQMQSG